MAGRQGLAYDSETAAQRRRRALRPGRRRRPRRLGRTGRAPRPLSGLRRRREAARLDPAAAPKPATLDRRGDAARRSVRRRPEPPPAATACAIRGHRPLRRPRTGAAARAARAWAPRPGAGRSRHRDRRRRDGSGAFAAAACEGLARIGADRRRRGRLALLGAPRPGRGARRSRRPPCANAASPTTRSARSRRPCPRRRPCARPSRRRSLGEGFVRDVLGRGGRGAGRPARHPGPRRLRARGDQRRRASPVRRPSVAEPTCRPRSKALLAGADEIGARGAHGHDRRRRGLHLRARAAAASTSPGPTTLDAVRTDLTRRRQAGAARGVAAARGRRRPTSRLDLPRVEPSRSAAPAAGRGRAADRRAHRREDRSSASAPAATPARPPQGLYPEGRGRRPQGLSAHRRIRGRRARRGLHRHAQGRRRLPLADEQLRHRRLDRPAIRRAAGGVRRRLRLHPLRAGRAGDRQRFDPLGHLDPGLPVPRAGGLLPRTATTWPTPTRTSSTPTAWAGAWRTALGADEAEEPLPASRFISKGFSRGSAPDNLVFLPTPPRRAARGDGSPTSSRTSARPAASCR